MALSDIFVTEFSCHINTLLELLNDTDHYHTILYEAETTKAQFSSLECYDLHLGLQ